MPTNKTQILINLYRDKYKERFGLYPVVNYPLCGKMIKSLLKDHSAMGILRVIELYFEHENNQVFHLPSILSAYSVNKYLPMAKLDPRIYSDAEEQNKEIW